LKLVLHRLDRMEAPSFASLGKIPHKSAVLRSSHGQKIEKLCGRSEWQPRILYITADKVLIAHVDRADEISDQIPLVLHNLGHLMTLLMILHLKM